MVVCSDVHLPCEFEIGDAKVDSKFSSVYSFNEELKVSIGINGDIWGVFLNNEVVNFVESIMDIN